MGLLDSWRRKKKREQEAPRLKTRGTDSTMTLESGKKRPEVQTLPEQTKDELIKLVADYERLSQRREELQDERTELTNKLDNGEITAIEFRKELMNRIQEAAEVSDKLKDIASKLSGLGYKGILH